MTEPVAPEIIKYLDEDGLKQVYSRLNRRYRIVDELPSNISALEPNERKEIFIVREAEEEFTRFFPFVISDGKWESLGVSIDDIDAKADLVDDAVPGHLAALDEYGNIVDSGMYPGVFVALTSDSATSGRATDMRDIWTAYTSGIPVMLLDNRGNGLYASLNAAGYLWIERGYVREAQCTLDKNHKPVDDTIHGYCKVVEGEVRFYKDKNYTEPIEGVDNKFYLDCNGNKVYRFFDSHFEKVQRFIQFATLELDKACDPVWEDRTVSHLVYYRMVEPIESWSPDAFTVVKLTVSDSGGGGDIKCKADKVVNAVNGHLAGLSGDGNLTDSGLDPEDLATQDAIDELADEIDTKASTEYVNTELVKKADKVYVNTELAKKADTTYVNTELTKKADRVYVDTELVKKADRVYVDTELVKKADKVYVDTELVKKADKVYVDTELAKKADTGYVDTELAKKANQEDMAAALAGKVDMEDGKGLSTNDYTDADKEKLTSIEWRPAAEGGGDISLVTTGEKFQWNEKQDRIEYYLEGARVDDGMLIITGSDGTEVSFSGTSVIDKVAIPEMDLEIVGKRVTIPLATVAEPGEVGTSGLVQGICEEFNDNGMVNHNQQP